MSGQITIGQTLQSAYDEQYTDEMTIWREIGGKYKANNIITVCRNQHFKKVLECGAGEGAILKFLNNSNVFDELFAVEISDSGISQIRKRCLPKLKEIKKFNGYEIPYADKQFDMAYCSHVIEHVEHPRILLRELKRVSSFQVFEIPLEYSLYVDSNVKHYLSYGHINIYPPSLFKFLLKSEGYEILEELLTQAADEVIRYSNKKLKEHKSIINEMRIKIRPLFRFLRRLRYGKKYFNEFGFAAYTCLAKGTGELKIF